MEQAKDVAERMERALVAGDHVSSRALARALLADTSASPEHDGAKRVLRATEPDLFLPAVGLLGLGLVSWLVYNYLL